jgi:hypothetical protein
MFITKLTLQVLYIKSMVQPVSINNVVYDHIKNIYVISFMYSSTPPVFIAKLLVFLFQTPLYSDACTISTVHKRSVVVVQRSAITLMV